MNKWQGIPVFLTLCVLAECGVVSRHKPGECPEAVEMSTGFCTKDRSLCTRDDECDAILKCCNNGCYKECLKPTLTEAELAQTVYRSENKSEWIYTGFCKSKKDCPKFSRCVDDKCECMFGVNEYDENGLIQDCRASLLFRDHDRTKSELVSLGISLLIFFGYFALGTCLLVSIKRLRRLKSGKEELTSPLTRHAAGPGLTTPLHNPNVQRDDEPSTSNIYPQLSKQGNNDAVML